MPPSSGRVSSPAALSSDVFLCARHATMIYATDSPLFRSFLVSGASKQRECVSRLRCVTQGQAAPTWPLTGCRSLLPQQRWRRWQEAARRQGVRQQAGLLRVRQLSARRRANSRRHDARSSPRPRRPIAKRRGRRIRRASRCGGGHAAGDVARLRGVDTGSCERELCPRCHPLLDTAPTASIHMLAMQRP